MRVDINQHFSTVLQEDRNDFPRRIRQALFNDPGWQHRSFDEQLDYKCKALSELMRQTIDRSAEEIRYNIQQMLVDARFSYLKKK